MKRTIKLTESKLRGMIQEAVSSALNELDGRTYASARDKAMQRGEIGRANRFHKAGVDAWNRDYGYKKKEDFDGGTIRKERHMDDRFYPFTDDQYMNNNIWDWDTVDYNGDDYPEVHYNNYGNGRNFGTNRMDKSSNLKKKYIRTAKEMNDGSGTYVKGKGWK